MYLVTICYSDSWSGYKVTHPVIYTSGTYVLSIVSHDTAVRYTARQLKITNDEKETTSTLTFTWSTGHWANYNDYTDMNSSCIPVSVYLMCKRYP